MKTKIDATQWTCDADGCEHSEMVPVTDGTKQPEGWYVGEATVDLLSGVEWHAHKATCIGKAVKSRVEAASPSNQSEPEVGE